VVPLAAPASAADAPAATTDYAALVNPFIGTQGDHGHDGPGAIAPYGLATVTPQTNNPSSNPTGYDYAGTTFQGFTNLALDGVGGGGGAGDFFVIPTYQSYTNRPSTSSYSKTINTNGGDKVETANAGYYSISTTESGKSIDAQATAATRTGVQDFTFGSAGHAALVVDLQHNVASGGRKASDLTVGTSESGNTTLSGSFTGYFYGSTYKLFYYAETTAPTSSVQTWNGSTLGTSTSQDGTDIGAVLNFNATAGQHLSLRVTLSPISVAQAKRDAAVEVAGKTFDQVRTATKASWNATLGKVEVDATTTNDPTGDLKVQFYTHLYRLADTPMNATSTDGTYRGADGGIYKAVGYTHYDSWSLWDDFHKYAGIASVFPDVYRDTVQSLVDLYASVTAAGASSVSALVQSTPTVRFERAPVVVADAISKGAQLQGLEQAYPALAAQTGSPANLTNPDSRAGGVTGYAYDAYGMSVIANALGKTADAKSYLDGAARWAKLFDKDALVNNTPAKNASGVAAGVDKVGLIMPRSSNSDTASFNVQNPEAWQVSNLYQGTLWQYNWYDAVDLGGMVDVMGGKSETSKAVNYYFGTYTSDCTRMLHLYANEISVHAPFLFNYVGEASKTQDLTYNALTTPVCPGYNADGGSPGAAKKMIYQNTPDGMLQTMDNDAGTMSGYFVSTAMGLYAVATGNSTFQLTSPIFDKTTTHYPGGKDLVIEAPGVSSSNHYIQSATLNGQPLNRTWLSAAELAAGGVLHFTMGSSPSDWGKDGVAEDSVSDHVSSTLYHPSDAVATSTQVFAESAANDGSIGNAVSVSVTGATVTGNVGDDLTSQVTATGVPAGLTLKATKTGASTLDLTLTGKATSHLVDDSTDGLAVTLGTGAFSGTAPSAADRALTLKVRFAGYSLTPSTTAVTAGTNGAVSSTINLTLTGGATFTGTNGSAIPTGSVSFPGLPSGISAVLTKTGDTTAKLALTGTLTDAASFTILLTDAALSGATAAQVTGAGTTALRPFTLSPESTSRASLQALYDDARFVRAGSYSKESFAALTASLAVAKSALDNADATDYQLSQALGALQSAVDGLTIAEEFPKLTPNNVSEMAATLGRDGSAGAYTNFGATHNELWAKYAGVDLGDGASTFTVSYDKPGSSSTPNTWIDLRLGSATGTTVASTPMLANTSASGWGTYTTLTIDVDPAKFKGTQDVYVVFRSDKTNTSGAPYVGNFAWFQFGTSADDGGSDEPEKTTVEFESIQAANGLFANDSALVAETDYHQGSNGVDPSKDGLKTENDNGGRALAGVTTGAWVRYPHVDLGTDVADKLEVTYDAPSGKANAPKIEVYVDSMSGSPLVSADLDNTASGWGTYATTSIDLPSTLTGDHTLYFKFLSGTPNDPQFYVGNFDSFALVHQVQTTQPFEYAQLTPNNVTELGPGIGRDGSAGAYTNFGNTQDGEWIKFAAVDFGPHGADTLSFSYDKPTDKSNDNTWFDVRLGSATGPTVASTPTLAYTGTGWNHYANASISVDPSVFTGTQDVYIVFRQDPVNTTQGAPYVGNFKWFQFGDTTAAPTDHKTVEFESIQAANGTFDADPALVAGTDYQNGDNGGAASQNQLKTENNNGGRTVGGTTTGAWIRYPNINVGSNIATAIQFLYDAPTQKAVDPKIAVYVDSMSGDPLVTASLPNTGSGWGTYKTATFVLPTELTGNHTLYFKLLSTPTTAQPYVANLDSFTLVYGVEKSALRTAVAGYADLAQDGDLYVQADFGVFTRALDAAQAVLDNPTATATDVSSALRVLDVSAGQLEWKVIRQLDELVTDAEAIHEGDVTPGSWSALQSALTAARALDPQASTHEAYETALGNLQSAYDDLDMVYTTTLTVHGDSTEPGATVLVTGTGFAPGEVVTFTTSPELVASWTVTAEGNGDVTTSLVVPASASDGTYTVKAVGAVSAVPATGLVTVAKVMLVSETAILGAPASVIEGTKIPVSVGVSEGATGTVRLFDGATLLGTATLDEGSKAELTVGPLAVGTHALTAVYAGDDTYLASTSAPVTVTVTAGTTPPVQGTITVSAPVLSKASQAYGSKPGLLASLSSQVSGATSGTVTFKSGTRVLGSAPVVKTGAGYAATLTLPATLAKGAYRGLTATFVTGDGRTAVSVASAATFQVVKATAKKVKVTGKKFKAGTRPKVKVKVGKLSNGQKPVGKIKVYVGKKVVKTAKLKAKKNGKITVKLPKKYRSTIKVRAKFVPKDKTVVKAKKSKAVKVKTKK